MKRRIVLTAALAMCCAASVFAARSWTLLPTGWRLQPPQGPLAAVGDMPQGIALSPDGKKLAVVESGVDPASVRILSAGTLRTMAKISVPGAFGAPVWDGNDTLYIAGANADGTIKITPGAAAGSQAVVTAGAKSSWPAAVALESENGTSHLAAANDGDGTVTFGGASVRVGDHPADLVFAPGGKTLYVSVRQSDSVAVVDTASKTVVARIPVGRHPGALALTPDGSRLYVAESDDDSVGIVDTASRKRTGGIAVGVNEGRLHGPGASPNALLLHGSDLFVSLGAQNSVALIRGGHVAERIPAGWYPTGIAAGADGTLYVANGRGEGAPPNPQFDPFKRNSPGYVGSLNVGSVRAIARSIYASAAGETQLALAAAQPQWTAPPANQTVVRAHGPVGHVIYVIKENRSYDQVLGDLSGANGDKALVSYGAAITPNQHALARRFGTFDNAYTDAEVSASGHNWTDAAFANDYVERFWPPQYGGRRDLYDAQSGAAPDVPHSGYLWDAARRAHITFRDYGENIDFPPQGLKIAVNTFAGLNGHFDPRYVGWDLRTSDLARYAEWHREFAQFVKNGNLPQLEIVYLPNDHTSATAPGMPTPRAYIATNDLAVGRLVSDVSRSKYWRSTAIFILEDDSQNGPDHVSDQRSTFYIASPYAKGGLQHAHYSTSSFVRTIELMLGLQPLSIYDTVARPLYDAFGTSASNAAPFAVLTPQYNLHAVNAKTAYKAQVSAHLDFSHPDAVDENLLNDILEHASR